MREMPTDLLRLLVEIVDRSRARHAQVPSLRVRRTAKRLRIVKKLVPDSAT